MDTSNQTRRLKRNRASGQNLDILKRSFAQDTNPPTDARTAISIETGMPEKSVRIWFQNYRAKMRRNLSDKNLATRFSDLLDGTNNARYNTLSSAYGIGEHYFVGASYVSIGRWSRENHGQKSPCCVFRDIRLSPRSVLFMLGGSNLMILYSETWPEINYFFLPDDGPKILFRVFYPSSSIAGCFLSRSNDLQSRIQVLLSLSPKFAIYCPDHVQDQWTECPDFSQGCQIARSHYGVGGDAVPHILYGPVQSFNKLARYMSSYVEPISFNIDQTAPSRESLNNCDVLKDAFRQPALTMASTHPSDLKNIVRSIENVTASSTFDRFLHRISKSELADDNFMLTQTSARSDLELRFTPDKNSNAQSQAADLSLDPERGTFATISPVVSFEPRFSPDPCYILDRTGVDSMDGDSQYQNLTNTQLLKATTEASTYEDAHAINYFERALNMSTGPAHTEASFVDNDSQALLDSAVTFDAARMSAVDYQLASTGDNFLLADSENEKAPIPRNRGILKSHASSEDVLSVFAYSADDNSLKAEFVT